MNNDLLKNSAYKKEERDKLESEIGTLNIKLASIEFDFRQIKKERKWLIGYKKGNKEVFKREKYLDLRKRDSIIFAYDLEFGGVMIPYDPSRLIKEDKQDTKEQK